MLLYRAATSTNGSDPATNFERAFASNGWPPQWRDGVSTTSTVRAASTRGRVRPDAGIKASSPGENASSRCRTIWCGFRARSDKRGAQQLLKFRVPYTCQRVADRADIASMGIGESLSY